MKNIIILIVFFYKTTQIVAQSYYSTPQNKRCEYSNFNILIPLNNSCIDSLFPIFDFKSINKVIIEAKCDSNIQNSKFDYLFEIPICKLSISFKNDSLAYIAYNKIKNNTLLPSMSNWYPLIKGGPMYVTLRKEEIELFFTNYSSNIFFNRKLLERYFKNSRSYSKILEIYVVQKLIR